MKVPHLEFELDLCLQRCVGNVDFRLLVSVVLREYLFKKARMMLTSFDHTFMILIMCVCIIHKKE